jgi:hypothetical protein
MTDLNTIRVIHLCGKVDVRSFFSKAKRFGFKDLLLGRLTIPSLDEDFE